MVKRRRERAPAKPKRGRRRVEALQRYLKNMGKGEEGKNARAAFALRVGTTLPYLEHIVQGFRQASMPMAIRIEQETYGIVRAEELHPSQDWLYLTQRKPGLDGHA